MSKINVAQQQLHKIWGFGLNGMLVLYLQCAVFNRKLRLLFPKPCVAAGRWATYKKPAAQTAHLVFANTKANAKKPKELFLANARQKTK